MQSVRICVVLIGLPNADVRVHPHPILSGQPVNYSNLRPKLIPIDDQALRPRSRRRRVTISTGMPIAT